MKIIGLKVAEVIDLENGFSQIILDGGSQIIAQFILAPPAAAVKAKPELEDEDEEETKKPAAGKKPAAKPEPEEDLTWEDLKGMDEDELKDLIDDESLDTDPDDYEDDLPGLRKAIAKEMEIEIPKKK